jgi:tRNA(His) guanylyltransferase
MLVLKGGMSNIDAEKELQVQAISSDSTKDLRSDLKQGTVSSDKNEILFKRFGINYNNEPEIFKKGSVVYRKYQLEDLPALQSTDPEGVEETQAQTPAEKELSRAQQDKHRKLRRKAEVVVEHADIIKDEFWQRRPWILSNKPGRLPT